MSANKIIAMKQHQLILGMKDEQITMLKEKLEDVEQGNTMLKEQLENPKHDHIRELKEQLEAVKYQDQEPRQ
jgi:flagellar biogenesis protein FliO